MFSLEDRSMLSEEYIVTAVKQALNLIPEQGPLEFFVHHNTIQHYQHLDFFIAAKKAACDYKCNAFMSEEFYWQEYTQRGINKTELFHEIDRYIKQNQLKIPNHIFYRLIIQKKTANKYLSTEECTAVREYFKTTNKSFYQFAIREDLAIDIDHFITPVILKFLSAYFDYGVATWSLEAKDRGLWHCFCAIHGKTNLIDSKFLKSLSVLITSFKSLPAKLALQSMLTKLKSFIKESIRVFKITRKPTKAEFLIIVKVSSIGIGVIGLIGFLITIGKELL